MLRSKKKTFGFTLLELLVALGILGVLMAVGIPMMSDWSQRAQVASETHRIQGAFALARSTAITTSNVVTVRTQPNADLAWDIQIYVDAVGVGGTAFSAANGDQMIKTIVGEASGIDVAKTPAGEFVSFDAQGRLMGGAAVSIEIEKEEAVLGRTIDISLVGRTSVTEIVY